MEKYYLLCNKLISVEAECFPGDNPLWSQFETGCDAADITVKCRICEEFPVPNQGTAVKSGEFVVSVEGNTVYRAFPMVNTHGALTKYTPADTSYSETFFTSKSFPVMMDSRYMWSSLSLAQLMVFKNAFFVHASYIDVCGKGILFSAPCGTGKSTQAALWEKHRRAEIINGDKAGILVENGVYACGVPFCGTSGICKNKTLPLGAIILLSQSAENSVKRLTGLEALQGVLQNVYLDLIAPNEQQMIFDLLIELLKTVPVYHLSCTPDENAVTALENALKDGGVV